MVDENPVATKVIGQKHTPTRLTNAGYPPSTLVDTDLQAWVSHTLEDSSWDTFLAGHPQGHYLQTASWGRLKASSGWRIARIIITNKGTLVAGAQILLRSLPLLGTVGYIAEGPLFTADAPSAAALFLETFQELAETHRIGFIVMQPPRDSDSFPQQLLDQGFKPSSITFTPASTLVQDLTEDPEAILGQMRGKTRRCIRRGLRKGVRVYKGGESDLPIFYTAHREAARRIGFPSHPQEYWQDMWRNFRPSGNIHLFLAEYRGEPVTTLLVLTFRSVAYAHALGWSGRHKEVHPNQVLIWEVIRWAQSQGLHYFDHVGIDPLAANALLKGDPLPDSLRLTPTHFKLGFGGEIILSPGAYDYVYNPVLRRLYRIIYPRIAERPTVRKLLSRFR